ncbi:eCIS core domain-containing protein [Microbacterium sp. DT81.1]|uniref:eCIS core domain-containing protein n=1 Tax=Microbacterium sp. DT81.1 TaxID=3393413 RepID=UPI003CF08E7F
MSALTSAAAPERTRRRPVTARMKTPLGHDRITAPPGERIALPHRETLEERFGRPLDTIAVYAGPTVSAALSELRAVSATRDEQIFLASASAPLPVVAHEVAHALQTRSAGSSPTVEPEGSPAEREASDAAVAVGRPQLPGDRVSISEGIGQDTLALLRVPAHRDGAAPTLGLPSATPSLRPEASAPAPQSPTAEAVEPSSAVGPAPTETTSTPDEAPAGGLELPPAPELTVNAEQVAAQEAAIAEAESALSGAGDAAALLEAYAAAPPTVKARRAATLGSDVAAVSATEGAQWQSDVPDLHASLSGADPPAIAEPVAAPPVSSIDLALTAPAPAPEPEIPDVEVPGTFEAEQDVTRSLVPVTEADPQALAAQIGDSLDAVQTIDPAVPRSAGPPPGIPLGGETDPARVAETESAGRAQAAAAREEATQAVLAGPGPEQVQPTSVDEPFAVGELPVPDVAAAATPEGPAAYVAMELPVEVQVAFDEQQHAAMEQSMAATVAQSEQATADRDTAKESAVLEAEAGVAELNEEADGSQTSAVAAARTDIQTARQDTVDAQQSEVERVEAEAGERRLIDESAIQTKVDDEQQIIDSAYATAEHDIGDQVAEGERQAAATKEEAERAAEDESWWDQAVSFVKDAFNALVDAIGAVFDAVRSAVNDILDAVKAAALAAIDAAANFIKDAIAAYGELLKSVITGLLGEVFPELAAALNSAIDTAVTAAQNAVDSVADALKAGVNALVEGLRAGLMAIIDAYQAAITLALSVASAAITGDWGALALRVLEAVLRLVGIDPEEFYAFVGRAQETFQMIVDDPAGFLANVVAAVTGGIQNFADNIVTHLQTGVIGWLTGALGPVGIVLPQSFDLLGVLDLARQILGLTWDALKAKARKLIGEQNVERLEVVFGFIETLVTEGWGGLWTKIMDSVSSVLDLVFDGIKTFIRDRIILAAITKLASLFSPVGAIVQLVLTAWNIYTFLRDQLARMMEVVQTVTTAIGDIARGVLDNAKAGVEGVLARLLPLAIDLLARVIGLGNVGEKVQEIVEQVRAMVDKGIDALLQRVAAVFTGGGAAGAKPAGATGGGTTGEESIPSEPSVLPESETISEPFSIAGEDHTLRSVIVGDEATADMASGTFGPLVARIATLRKTVTNAYVKPGSPQFVGDVEATVLTDKLTVISTRAATLVSDLTAAKAPPGSDKKALAKAASAERKIVRDGFTELRILVEGLGLKTVTSAVLHPGHGPKAGGADSYGRRLSFSVNPLSITSLDKGGGAQDPVPGVRLLPGYDRGHLVAKSLGGPGSPENLVPMSKAANTKRVGIQAVEESLRTALRFTAANPEQFPPDNPQYIFSYDVWVRSYHSDADLQQDLESHAVTAPGSNAGARLFALAAGATSKGPSDTVLLAAAAPVAGLDAKTMAALPGNLRRRTAYFFHPTEVVASVEVLQEPNDSRTRFPIHTGGPVPTHMDVDVLWHA